jgi:hypothetical protein
MMFQSQTFQPAAFLEALTKGVRSHLPERPEGCYAQMRPDPFCQSLLAFRVTFVRSI